MKINTVLYTKDGRLIGNAIIIQENSEYNLIKTDYGNICKLTDNEINKLYYIENSYMCDEMIHFNVKTHKNCTNQ